MTCAYPSFGRRSVDLNGRRIDTINKTSCRTRDADQVLVRRRLRLDAEAGQQARCGWSRPVSNSATKVGPAHASAPHRFVERVGEGRVRLVAFEPGGDLARVGCRASSRVAITAPCGRGRHRSPAMTPWTVGAPAATVAVVEAAPGVGAWVRSRPAGRSGPPAPSSFPAGSFTRHRGRADADPHGESNAAADICVPCLGNAPVDLGLQRDPIWLGAGDRRASFSKSSKT